MDWIDTMVGTLELWQVLTLVGVGLLSGSLGGMLGIGGGVVNIPLLTLLVGVPIHLAQAASMCVTPFVAGAAAVGHHKERAVCVPLLVRLLPAAVIFLIAGVTTSIWIEAWWLELIFGVFLIWVAFIHIRKLMTGAVVSPEKIAKLSWARASIVAGCFGFGAGLLGIGGGLITVPLLGIVCRLPLRQCIATSSAVMVLTSIIGAVYKNATLGQIPDLPSWIQWWTPLEYAAWLIPSCLVSSWCAARWSHRMPLRAIRTVFVALVLVASWRLLEGSNLPWREIASFVRIVWPH